MQRIPVFTSYVIELATRSITHTVIVSVMQIHRHNDVTSMRASYIILNITNIPILLPICVVVQVKCKSNVLIL